MIECKRSHAFDEPCELCFPDDSKCAVCSEDHDYEDHKPGSELRHEFEPESAERICQDCGLAERYHGATDPSVRHNFAPPPPKPSFPSREAQERADKVTGRGSGEKFMKTWRAVADAMQALIDERDAARDDAMVGAAAAARECARAEAAEADAALAWRRVTELQARGTELVEARRALAEVVRAYARLLPQPFNEHLSAILAKHEVRS